MYDALLAAVLQPTVYQATKFVSPTHVLKATRQRFDGKVPSRTASRQTVIVTIGKPNYKARQFIKLYQKAGESFPIKKIQIKLLA